MNRSRVKSPEILNMGRFSPQSQSPRPFSPNEGAHPSPKAPLSKFSTTAKQPRIISSARHASRNLSLIPTPTLQQPSQTSKVNMKIALFDHLPGLKKVSSQSTRSSYAAPFSDRNENTDSEQLPSPGKQVHTDNPIDNSSPILTKSIFNKLHHEKSERKVSFRESDTEDMTVSSVFSAMEQKPKVGKVRVSTRFAVLNKVVAQSQKGKTGVLKNSPGGNDTLEADSVVSVHLSPEKKEVEPVPRKGLNFGLGNPESLMKPVQRKRESFSANPSNRKQPGEGQQKTEEERRSSRIMTKELEMKFGIQLDESEGTSSESEEGQTDIKRSPKRDKKLEENGQQPGEGSPKKKRFSAVREFILRKNAMENLKVEAKREELEKQQAELFVKNYPESARDRPRTQGPLSGIFDNERRFSERPIAFAGKPEGEKVFVNGTNNFFQLNPESRTYKEFKGIFDEDLKAFGNPGSPDKKEEEKEGNDEYKPMIVYFSAGSKILQPKYMTKMGSMCCTELWPKKLSMYMQKHLVQAKDCVRLADTGRNHEMVYRPKKWQKEEHIQKNISKNIQSRRNGHDALMVKSAVPSSRKTRSVQAQKAGFEV